MLPLVVLSLFPNLELFYPTNVDYFADSLVLSGSLYIRDCKKEIREADECVAGITSRYNASHPFNSHSFYSLPKKLIRQYSQEVMNSDCLNKTCSSVELIREVYVNSSSMVLDIFGIAYDCLEKESETILTETKKCDDTNSFLHYLEECSIPIIERLQCNGTEIRALIEAVKISFEINEQTFLSSSYSVNIFSCVLVSLLIKLVILS